MNNRRYTMKKAYTQALQVLFWLCLCFPVYANCTNEFAMHAAEISGYKDNELIDCKVMPNNRKQTIVAFVSSVGNHEYTMTTLVVTTDTGSIRSKFVDEDPSFGASGDPNKIKIDTAKYDVARNKRAFGVRVTYSLNSWDSTEDLNLFLEDGNQLKEIMKGLTVGFSNAHLCNSNQMKGIISISQLPAGDFQDLILTASQSSIEGVISNDGECTTLDPVTNTSIKTIHFKDGAYDVYGN